MKQDSIKERLLAHNHQVTLCLCKKENHNHFCLTGYLCSLNGVICESTLQTAKHNLNT